MLSMANMAKQMELFDEGGLMQEGGTVDPVSGNDVPVGSTQEEVRDDIPAQLSEGEFVMPADVVRYHGLDKMMALRDEAKMGLQRMEAMGQMGNADEATIPDGVPFGMEDLEMEDDGLEMNVGGVVGSVARNPGVVQNLMGPLGTPMGSVGTFGYTPPPAQVGTQVVVYGPDGTAYASPQAAMAAGVNNYTMTPPAAAPAAPTGQAATPMQAASSLSLPQPTAPNLSGTKFTPTTIQPVMPTFQQTIGAGVPGVDYTLPGQDDKTEEADSPTTVSSSTTRPTDDGDGGGDIDTGTGTGTTSVGSISELLNNFKGLIGGGDPDAPRGKSVGDIFVSAADKNNYYGGSKDFGFGNEALRKATAVQGASQLGSFGLTGIVTELTKAAGITDFTVKDIGVAGFTGMNQALNSMGLTNRGQLMNDRQATLVGQAMSAAHVAAYKGQNPQAAINKVLGTQEAIDIQDRAYDAIKNAYVEKAGVKGTFTDRDFANEMARVERSAVEAERRGFNRQTPRDSRPGQEADAEFRSNVVTDRNGNPVTSKRTGKNVLTAAGKAKKDRLNAITNQARVNKQEAARRAEYEEKRQAGIDARVAQQEAIAKQQKERIESGQYSDDAGPTNQAPASATDYGALSPEDVANMYDDSGDGGYDPGSDSFDDPSDFGGVSDNYGGGDYKGAFVGEAYKKNKLASQMKRSGLASKK